MSNFQPLEVVDHSSDTQLQVIENLNNFHLTVLIMFKVHVPSIIRTVLTDLFNGISMLEIKY